MARAAAARAAAHAAQTGAKPAAKPPHQQMPAWYLTPAQMRAQALAEAQAFYASPIAAAKQQQALLATQHAAQQAGLLQLYKVLADSFKGVPGQVQGIYQTAAQDQSAFGKGYSQGLQMAQDAAAKDTNAQLNQIGAPEGQQENPGSGAANALYAVGGAIPADALEQQGAAFATAASYLPSQALLQGQMKYLDAVQSGNAESGTVANQIADLEAQVPGRAQDYYGQLTASQAKAAKDAQPIFRTVNGSLVAIDPATGRSQVLYQKPPTPQKLTMRTLANGQIQAVDPFTGQPVGKPFGMPKATKQGKVAQQKINGAVYNVDPATGALTLAPGSPGPKSGAAGAKVILGQTGVPLTKGEINTYSQDTYALFKAALAHQYKTPNAERLRLADIISSLKKSPIPEGVWRPLVEKRFGIPKNLSGLANMSGARLRNIATYYGLDPHGPPLSSQGLRDWIRANAPKGEAAQGAATQTALALVREYLGTPYVWGGEKPGGFDCSGLLQYVWGKAGIQIPRVTYDQWTAGRAVAKGDLQPGDAVFFTGADPKNGAPGHVGMYIGGGKFIEAPGRGLRVRISSLSQRRDYRGARRYA